MTAPSNASASPRDSEVLDEVLAEVHAMRSELADIGRQVAPGAGTIYLSLHTAAPGTPGHNEISGNGYARIDVRFVAGVAGKFLALVSSTNAQFPAPRPERWGTITHFGLWDADSAGTCLTAGALERPIKTESGVPILFPAAAIICEIFHSARSASR